MNAERHDPIFDSLDRLAGLADGDVVGDRMLDIRRRVRVARQRRVAAAGVVAVTLLAAGIGLWNNAPGESQQPQPAPAPELTQTVTIEAEAFNSTVLQVAFTVTGTSSAYTDNVSGDPVPAGPFGTRVSVDGGEPLGSDPGDVSCEAGGEVSSYSLRFPKKNPRSTYTFEVSGPGEHTVEVHAPYCADGELVDTPTTLVVTTAVAEPTVMSQLEEDLDGDGTPELIQLLVPAPGEQGDQELKVTWADAQASAPLTNDGERVIEPPADLDGEGRPELVLAGGGGEFIGWDVFRVTRDHRLVQVDTVDEAGRAAPLSSGYSDGTPLDRSWQVMYTPGFFVSWRAREPFPTRPATVDIRRWELRGDTLVLLDQVEDGCWQQDLSVTVGGC
jgi:hypothetical protein